MAPLIEAQDLTRRFNERAAVDRLNLAIDQGQVLALLGHNGAGKTTTVRMLASILRPTSGEARIAGLDVERQAPQVRRIVGHLTETPGLYPRMTPFDYLVFFGELYGLTRASAGERALQLLEQFELGSDARRPLSEFSKGMRQKVALIRAMLHSPRALFLDEPTSGLDPQAAKQVRDAIARLRREGNTVLLCTHNLFEAEFLADRIAIIGRGKLLAMDTAEGLKLRYLGAPLMEIRLARPLGAPWPDLGTEIQVEGFGDTFLRYRAPRPEVTNPLVLRRLSEMGAEVVTISQAPQSLEQVYLTLAGIHGMDESNASPN